MEKNLEIVDEIKVIKGKFGYYHKDSKGRLKYSEGEQLVNNTVIYISKSDVSWSKNSKLKCIDSSIAELSDQLTKMTTDRKDFIERFEEMESVFDM